MAGCPRTCSEEFSKLMIPSFNSARNREEYSTHESQLEMVPTSIDYIEDYMIDELLCTETSSCEGSCCSYTDLFEVNNHEITNFSINLAFSESPPSAAPSHCNLQSNILAWSDATGLPATVSVHVAGKVYKLHKFPMVSLSGYMKRELTESDEVHLDRGRWWPGGDASFEVVASFCYGGRVALSPTIVAAVRCAAEVLDMSEDYIQGNLAQRCDVYLRQVALRHWSHALLVLQQCQSLRPLAESLLIVTQCVNAIATMACGQAVNVIEVHLLDDLHTASIPAIYFPASCDIANSIHSNSQNALSASGCFCSSLQELADDQFAWIHDLAELPHYHFSPIIIAAHRLGMRDEHIMLALLQYAETSIFSCFVVVEDGALKKKQHNVHAKNDGILQDEIVEKIETMLALLHDAIPCNQEAEKKERFPMIKFLFGLLKCTHACSGMANACKQKLECMIEKRLKNARISDFEVACSLLGAAEAAGGGGSHGCRKKARVNDQKRRRDQNEVESMLNIFYVFFSRLQIAAGKHKAEGAWEVQQREVQEQEAAQVTELWDAFMAEAAVEPELTVHRFVELAEVVPPSARHSHDSLYYAVDLFLQSHPSVSPQERQAVCKVLNCQKLSQGCCIKAVQNETMPLRIIVQAMFMHQLNTSTSTASGATPLLQRSASCHHHQLQQEASTPYPISKTKTHQLGNLLKAGGVGNLSPQPMTGAALDHDTKVLHTRLLTLENEIQRIKRGLARKQTNTRPPTPQAPTTHTTGWRQRLACLGLLRHATSPPRAAA